MQQSEMIMPKHVAIVMDGNGRWATKQGLIRSKGHYQGAENLRTIAVHASQVGVERLTVFAFSTENWKRDKKEINYIFSLPEMFFKKYFDELNRRNIKLELIGDMSEVPEKAAKVFANVLELTKNNTAMVLTFALNYGGRQEIVRATNKLVELAKDDVTMVIDEDTFAKQLDCSQDVDLLIRTSGELRISNFLLWQSAYAEWYITDLYWPEFKVEDFNQAIVEFNKRQRRFGGN